MLRSGKFFEGKYENGSILLEVAFTIFSLFIQFGEIGPLSDIHPYLSFPARYLLHSLSDPKWLLFIDLLFFFLYIIIKHERLDKREHPLSIFL